MSTESKVVVSAEDRASATLGRIKGSVDASSRALETLGKVTRLAAFAMGSNMLGEAMENIIRKGAETDARFYKINQNLESMHTSATAAAVGLTGSLAPSIAYVTDGLAALLAHAAGETGGYGLRDFWGDLYAASGNALKDAPGFVGNFGSALLELAQAQYDNYAAGGRNAQQQQEHNRLLAEGKALTEKYLDPAQKFTNYIWHLSEVMAAGAIDARTMERALMDYGRALDLLPKETRAFPPLVDAIDTRPLKIAEPSMEDYLDETLIWNPKILDAPAANVVTKWDQMWTTMRGVASESMESVNTAFTDILFDWGNRVAILENLFNSLAYNLANRLLGQYVTGPLYGALGLRAEGGPVSAGSAYVVGEKGPELFVPGSSGSIVPNAQLAGAGGVTLHYSPVIQAVDTRTGMEFLAGHSRTLVAILDRELGRRY